MKVLAAIDDDQASTDALAFAQQILHADDQVLVLNVVSTTDTAGVTFGLADTAVPAVWASVQEVVERQRQAGLKLVQDVAADVKPDAKALVSLGPVGPTICAVAEREAVDLIVLGTHDTGLWSRLWFGSVSDHVVKHAPCSVLIVR